MKRAYFGMEHKDADHGYGIVAESISEAKKLLYDIRHKEGEGERNWIELYIRARPDVNVDDLPIGIVEDLRLGLIAGFFTMITEWKCEFCGNISDVQLCDGKVVCDGCYDYIAEAKRKVEHP